MPLRTLRFMLMVLLVAPPEAGAGPISLAKVSPQNAPQAAVPDLSAFVGRVITAVRVKIEGVPADNPSLIDLLQVRTGTPLVEATVREALMHVRSLGRYESATVSVQAESSGAALVFSLVPLHPITGVVFRGSTGLDGRSLERAVLEQAGGRMTAVAPNAAADAV
ncbi:MAG: hypothetical protein ABIP90_10085, partial [Vicinamibacterales bacterium]